jgi:hypothetical protein
MKYNSNSYTEYPMLRPYSDDYPNGSVRTELSQEIRNEMVVIECEFDVAEPAVYEKINEGSAACCLLVYCAATCYTEMFRAEPGAVDASASIPCGALNGRVEVHPSVITLRDIVLPTSTAHPEYGGNLIPIERFRQIASSEPWVFQVKPSVRLESVFKLDSDASNILGDWEFDFESDPGERYIVIRANQKTYKRFRELRHKTETTRATVFLTALTQALHFVDLEPSDDEPPIGWASTVRDKLEETKLDIWNGHSCGLAAQRLLGEPLTLLGYVDN